MRRLLTLLAPLALLAGTGCVVTPYHGHTRTYRTVEVSQYRFHGPHPIAGSSSWCLEEYDHVHDYAPETQHYVYTDNVYRYQGPTVVWYMDYHPVPTGGHCNYRGRHNHDYYPRRYDGWTYSWDRGRDVYVYNNPRYTHGASPATGYQQPQPTYPPSHNSGGAYRPPPSGQGGWGSPPANNGGGYNPPPPSNSGGSRPPPGGQGGWGSPPSNGGNNPPSYPPPNNGGNG
ncbi:MAG TPA: hypothetical protein VK689_03560, partial [Armatimonadota bacterium]|nr:hypothetical protein [Armatimonadota bacterium]